MVVGPEARPQRRDAARNRALLLSAADDYLAERGLPIAFNSLARYAGVGVGTVYRHFTGPDELLDALMDRRVDAVVATLDRAAEVEDPIAGLRQAILGICKLQAGDRSVTQALTGSWSRFETVRARLLPPTRQIVERARASGRMRPEFAQTDFAILIWLGGALHAHAGAVEPRLWIRYVEALLDGFLGAAEPRQPLSVEALDVERMDLVVHRENRTKEAS